MSNNAEILSVPNICQLVDLPSGVIDDVDRQVRKYLNPEAVVDIPTAVGFCMAVNRSYLQKFPELDTIFGRGYGEEVDWCQKVRSALGRHVAQPALFVEHAGGASFGSETKRKAIAANGAILSQRYCDFDQDVQNFIQTDPLKTARLVQGISLLNALQDRTKVFIGHSLGGGAELFLKDEIAALQRRNESCVVLRVGSHTLWQIELYSASGCLVASTNDFATVLCVLQPLTRAEIIYSCAVGHPDPLSLPDCLSQLKLAGDHRLSILVHDHFCISESYTLLDSDGKYHGVSPNGTADLMWRATWQQAISNADRIVCFSASSFEILLEAYPNAADVAHIEPHSFTKLAPVSVNGADLVIGVLGDIGFQKGADCVSRLSRQTNSPTIVVIGRMDPTFALGESAVQTGQYDRQEIAEIAEKHGVNCWLIPSIWPETFSYTTHEALSTGLPVFVFDLGGQADAVNSAKNGYLLPLEWSNSPKRIIQKMKETLQHGSTRGGCHKRTKGRGCRGVAAR